MFGRTRRQRRERALNRLISRMNDPGRWNPLEGWKTRADRPIEWPSGWMIRRICLFCGK